MKVLNKSILLLLTGFLLLSTSCGGTGTENASQAESSSEAETAAAASSQTDEDIDAYDLYLKIQSVDISLDDLKERDYIVPVYVTLDKNAGINYTEWGLRYDSRCQMEATSDAVEVNFNIVASVNEEEHFVWTAWASTSSSEHAGVLLKLNVTVPEDAALGDTYPITYADTSLADKPHVWNSEDTNWVNRGSIGWQDGGITIAETSTLSIPNFYADELD